MQSSNSVSTTSRPNRLWIAWADRTLPRGIPLRSTLAAFRQQGRERSPGQRLASYVRVAQGHLELLEQKAEDEVEQAFRLNRHGPRYASSLRRGRSGTITTPKSATE